MHTPGETRAEVESTVRFALESKLHTAGFFLVTPFEGSPLADAYVGPAKDLHGQQFNYYDNPHSLSEVPAEELKVIQRNAYLRFYLDPRRVARFVQLLPRKRELLKLLPIFLKLVTGGDGRAVCFKRGLEDKSAEMPLRVSGPRGERSLSTGQIAP